MKTYKVKEIFGPTIQGEGTYTGQKVMFLRLSNCNKWSGKEEHKPKSICSYCDTDFVGGDDLTAADIVKRLSLLDDCDHLVISGGEPTLQLDHELLQALSDANYKLHLETNGSRDLGTLGSYFMHITMSPKQPLEKTKLTYCHDLKILYPAIHPDITAEKFQPFSHKAAYLQPVWDDKYEANLVNTIEKLYKLRNWKLSLQTHKIVGIA